MTNLRFCSTCSVDVRKEDIFQHIETLHVGTRPNKDTYYIVCGDCKFRVCDSSGETMIDHCFQTKHDVERITTDWSVITALETKRIVDVIASGVKLMSYEGPTPLIVPKKEPEEVPVLDLTDSPVKNQNPTINLVTEDSEDKAEDMKQNNAVPEATVALSFAALKKNASDGKKILVVKMVNGKIQNLPLKRKIVPEVEEKSVRPKIIPEQPNYKGPERNKVTDIHYPDEFERHQASSTILRRIEESLLPPPELDETINTIGRKYDFSPIKISTRNEATEDDATTTEDQIKDALSSNESDKQINNDQNVLSDRNLRNAKTSAEFPLELTIPVTSIGQVPQACSSPRSVESGELERRRSLGESNPTNVLLDEDTFLGDEVEGMLQKALPYKNGIQKCKPDNIVSESPAKSGEILRFCDAASEIVEIDPDTRNREMPATQTSCNMCHLTIPTSPNTLQSMNSSIEACLVHGLSHVGLQKNQCTKCAFVPRMKSEERKHSNSCEGKLRKMSFEDKKRDALDILIECFPIHDWTSIGNIAQEKNERPSTDQDSGNFDLISTDSQVEVRQSDSKSEPPGDLPHQKSTEGAWNRRTCYDDVPFSLTCTFCSVNFSGPRRKGSAIGHISTHTQLSFFQCNACSFKNHRLNSMRTHVRNSGCSLGIRNIQSPRDIRILRETLKHGFPTVNWERALPHNTVYDGVWF